MKLLHLLCRHVSVVACWYNVRRHVTNAKILLDRFLCCTSFDTIVWVCRLYSNSVMWNLNGNDCEILNISGIKVMIMRVCYSS